MPISSDPKNVLHINDFTPGIHSNGMLASTTPAAPPGAAQELNTYGCIALPSGGLGPLPSCAPYKSAPASLTVPTGGATTVTAIAGVGSKYGLPGHVIVHANSKYVSYSLDADPFILTAEEWTSTDAVNYVAARQTIPSTPSSFPYGLDINHGVSKDAGVGLTPASQILAGRANLSRVAGDLYCTYFEYDVVGTRWRALYAALETGEAFGFEQRNSWLSGVPDATVVRYDSDDPALSPGILRGALNLRGFLGGQTYGVISTGEFLIISKGRGALRLSGSFEYPQIVELPGVTSTGAQSMRAVPSPIGLLYCVDKIGVFVWNGSNTSQLISSQLRPTFFERTTPTYDSSGGQSVQAAKWGQWSVFPNGFMYDPNIKSWWRLADSGNGLNVIPAVFWTDEFDVLFSMPDTFIANAAAVQTYNRAAPATYYSWQSHTIPVSSPGRLVRVTDIEIRVVPSANEQQSVTITLTSSEGVTTSETFTFTSPAGQPIRLRKTTSCTGFDVVVRIEAQTITTNPAPVIHDIALSWTET